MGFSPRPSLSRGDALAYFYLRIVDAFAQCLSKLDEDVLVKHLFKMDVAVPASAAAPMLESGNGDPIGRFAAHSAVISMARALPCGSIAQQPNEVVT